MMGGFILHVVDSIIQASNNIINVLAINVHL